MSNVEHPDPQADNGTAAATAAAAAKHPPPALRTIDFSSNDALRQVSTMLRRAWLLDPPLTAGELADPAAVRAHLRTVCEALGRDGLAGDAAAAAAAADDDDDPSSSSAADPGPGSATDKSSSRWDHEGWLARTQLPVLEAPVVVAGAEADDDDDDEEEPDPRSVVSPWRDEIYDVYRHVFVDLWRMLRAEEEEEEEAGAEGVGTGWYDPTKGTAVSVAAVQAPPADAAEEEAGEGKLGGRRKGRKVDRMAYRTDTFLFPVWVNPGARLTFAAGGDEHVWGAAEEEEEKRKKEEATWATGLWVRGAEEVVLTTDMVGVDEDETGIAAVFVTGHCEEMGDLASEEAKLDWGGGYEVPEETHTIAS